jgi:hypothetical protein
MYYLLLIAFCRIPFQTIPVSILEWLHSAGINGVPEMVILAGKNSILLESVGESKDLEHRAPEDA